MAYFNQTPPKTWVISSSLNQRILPKNPTNQWWIRIPSSYSWWSLSQRPHTMTINARCWARWKKQQDNHLWNYTPNETPKNKGNGRFQPPNSRSGGWSNNQNDLMDHIFFFSGKWWLHGSIHRKIHPPEKAHRLEPEQLVFFFLFQNLANINRPFIFQGGVNKNLRFAVIETLFHP